MNRIKYFYLMYFIEWLKQR